MISHPVVTSTTQSVLQNYSFRKTKCKLETFRGRLQLETHLSALTINALFVAKAKMKRSTSCNLQFADVALSHIIGSACLGTLNSTHGLNPVQYSTNEVSFISPYCYSCITLFRNISFKDCGPHIFQRAWTGLLHNRILIYCLYVLMTTLLVCSCLCWFYSFWLFNKDNSILPGNMRLTKTFRHLEEIISYFLK